MQNHFGLLITGVIPIFMIIALDIFITMRFSINYSAVICSPTVIHAILREATSEPYGPQVSFLSYKVYFPSYKFPIYYFAIFYFPIYKPKTPKIPNCNLFIFTLVCSFIYLLYLSLSDLTLVGDHEGIDNPFFALCASVCQFVQVHILETCLCLLLD